MRVTHGIALVGVLLLAGCYVDDEIEPDIGGGGGGETDGALPESCTDGDREPCYVEGECRGERICADGVFGECTAPAEMCDGRDNDCDGTTDEGYPGLGDACEAGDGACVDRGRVVCSADGADVVCDATPGDGTADVCDAIDNDCDGAVDEEAATGDACDTGRFGVCAAGTIDCAAGDVACVATAEPSDEVCDGLDNDCDGRVDEDGLGGQLAEPCYEGPEGTEGVGICAGGVRLCVDGAFDACTGAVTPLGEICDGLDNDCDGTVDTGDCACVPGEARACYSGPEGTEGIGACAPGRQICGADGTFGACRGEVTPTAEACDGVDNDCDGAVDDVPGAGQPCTDGVGACAVDGSRVCDLESGRLVCDAVAGAPADEVCDGIDNDCDGVVDDVEGVGELCTIGEGACFDRGAQRCVDGALACDAVEGEPGAETCNQIDDDCNGEVDDVPGLDEHCEIGTGICRSTALTKCDYETGAVFCPATEQDPEPADYCGNRVDDDCDGEVDEEGCTIRCAVDDDCPGGYCNGRLCVACLADDDCGDGDICVDGACVAPLDSDGDGIADVVDVDDDNDGIPDASECFGALDGQTSVINGGFEVPPLAAGANRQTPEADVPGWETTEGPGSIEMWGTGFLGVPAAVGGAFAEINAFEADGALYQDVATIPGTIFTWSFYHRGRLGEDELELRAGPPDATVTITTAATGNQAWRRYTGTYVVPDGQMLTRFEFRSIRSTGGAGLGNFVDGVEFLPSCPADADADADGIPNALDLDSDDDGIPDAEEAGHDQPHTDGRVDGPVGGNGLVDALETVPDSGIIDYALRDGDGDGIYDFLDPDGAACGNGALDDGEGCDDGNTDDGDGCSSTCQVEDGYTCADPGLGPCAPDQPVETIDLVPGDNLPAVGGQGGTPFADSCPVGEVIVGFDYRIGDSFGGDTYVERSRAQCARLDLVAGEARLTLTGVTPERGGPPASGVPPGYTHEVRCPEGQLVRGYTGYGDAYVSGVALLCSTLSVEAGGVVLGAPVEQPPVGRTDDDLGTFTCPDGHVVGANSGRDGFIIDQFTMRCDAIVEACRTGSVCEADGEICDDQLDNDDDGDIDCRDADCDGAAACDGACFSDDDCLDGEICTDGFCAQSDDADGDGVPDVRDLDDDNDGILDTDECTPGLGAVINSSFEAPVIADGAFLYIQPQDQGGAFGWTTNVPDQPVEIQGRGHATAPEAALGRQYGEANAAVVGGFYQDVATVPGHTYEWTMYHRGRDGVDSLQVRFGAPGPVETLTPIVTAVTDNDAWILYSGTYTVPVGQEITRLSFATIFAAGGASRGNFIDGFTFTPVCDLDTDGDGLVNSRDLDSDADGIPDAEEAGHDQPHTNGVVDGPVGGNGVPDAVETVPDSSDVAYTLRETDGDGIFDFLDDDGAAGPAEICDNDADDDDDGDVDCGDIDCRDDAACAIESTFYFITPAQAGTPAPVAPTRLYTLNGAGDVLLLGDVTLDGVPAIVTALALSPAGELYGFERHSDAPQSRLIAIDRETAVAVPVDDYIAGEIMGAGFDPDGRLWVLDDTTQQLAEYIDGALAPSLDLPVQFDGGDIAFDATGACYLTGAALGDAGGIARDLYRCDPDAGTLESVGALATAGFIDGEGDVRVTAIAFSYDDVTCASTLYALDGLAIDELGTIDIGAEPPLMSQVASTGVNYSWFVNPDGAGFPSAANSPACAGRVEICDNGADDDGNGATDCDDVACQGVPACPIGLPDFEVTVRGFDMLPGSARVPVGTTVRWTNEDGARHTVTSGAPGDADAGTIFDGDLPGNGGTFAFTFDVPGEYPYFCRPHAGSMFGYSIIVE